MIIGILCGGTTTLRTFTDKALAKAALDTLEKALDDKDLIVHIETEDGMMHFAAGSIHGYRHESDKGST